MPLRENGGMRVSSKYRNLVLFSLNKKQNNKRPINITWKNSSEIERTNWIETQKMLRTGIYIITNNQIKEIEIKEAEGAKIRSKAQWREQGETSSRYFCSLEKKRGAEKIYEKCTTCKRWRDI